jgi:phosphoenolpyruvate carboxykinase (GTP)
MLPFCGYNMADYFAHWLQVGAEADQAKLPRLFYVNWFRKGADGRFLWPGYGDNSRVVKWIVERIEGAASAVDTPIGRVPAIDALDVAGLALSPDNLLQLLTVDEDEWRHEIPLIEDHYATLGERIPEVLTDQLRDLEKRLAQP